MLGRRLSERAAQADEPGSKGRVIIYPPSSQLDFSSTLDAPAGKHGFVSAGSNGHFVSAKAGSDSDKKPPLRRAHAAADFGQTRPG